jgi:hypothetical protein
MITPKNILAFVFAVVLTSYLSSNAQAKPLSADAVVERSSVFVGEPFIFQIQVSGSENPEKPDLSEITDFIVEYHGGQANSSRSVTIINGRMTQNVKQGYVFSYRLIPKRTGKLLLPSVAVHANGQSVQTNPVVMHVQKPAETDDFKLRLDLSKQECYVGEPVTLTVIWYLGKDVRKFSINLPLLDQKNLFYFFDPQVDFNSGKKFYHIPVGDGEVIGEKGRGRLGDKDFATITFKKVLIPKQEGIVNIKPATLFCEALTGYRQMRQSPFGKDFFSDFFNDDFFSLGRQGVYQKVIVPSNTLNLKVYDVPAKGQPANFAGHVGEYKIEAQATPTQMSVGDPITLTLTLSGPDYLEQVDLPPLDRQPELNHNFKIPKERAVGEASGKIKVFTQTIRPLKPDITEIPSIELSYFDTRTREYRIARTDPIPIQVKAARVVTALDAEGAAASVSSGSEIETWAKGIAYNYEDMSVIENHGFGPVSWLRSPVWFCMIVIPPILYLILWVGLFFISRQNADPFASRARKAYGRLTASIKKAQRTESEQQSYEVILNAFRKYLGDKLQFPQGSLTFNDVKDSLSTKGVDSETLGNLKGLFERCEARRFAGNSDMCDASSLVEQSITLAKKLENTLK